MARKPPNDGFELRGVEQYVRAGGVLIGSLMMATMPAAAFVEEAGRILGQSGGGAVAAAFWVALLAAVIFVGSSRVGTAFNHMGSIHEDTRAQGKREMFPAGMFLLIGVVAVIAASTFLSRSVTSSWSWIAVDPSQYINIPFVGGSDGGSGATQQTATATNASGGPGTIYSPEIGNLIVDVSHHATDLAVTLV